MLKLKIVHAVGLVMQVIALLAIKQNMKFAVVLFIVGFVCCAVSYIDFKKN